MLAAACLLALLAGCDSDLRTDVDGDNNPNNVDSLPPTGSNGSASNELLTLQMGPESILVVVSMDFADRLDAAAVENTVAGMRDRIREEVAGVSRVFIQVEPTPGPRSLSDSPAGTGSS